MKLQLPTVTLVCINSDRIEESLRAVEHCTSVCEFGAVKHFTDVIDNNNRPHVMYNNFVINELWKYIETPHVMIIQWDGFILNPGAWRDEFLYYDYIGAPWDLNNADAVGNGGFSIRSKRLLHLASLLNIPPENCMPEDDVICRQYRDYFTQNTCMFAPVWLAKLFSVEVNGGVPDAKYTDQFGFHNIYTPGVKEKLN